MKQATLAGQTGFRRHSKRTRRVLLLEEIDQFLSPVPQRCTYILYRLFFIPERLVRNC
jgi:hypothetical protein